MKKTIFFSTSLLLAFILLNPVSAQQGRAQDFIPGEPVKTEKTVKVNQNTKNQGEEQNLQIENTLQGEAGEAVQDGDLIQEQSRNNRDKNLLKIKSKDLTLSEGAQLVKEKQNDVAQQVQQLLAERFASGEKGGIGEQVRVIAQNQLKAQEEVQNRFTNLEEKPIWQRFIFGQDQEDLSVAQVSLQEKQEQLTELQTLLEDDTLSVEDRLELEELYLELLAEQELEEAHFANIVGEFNVVGFFRKLFRRS
jgi:hypothetical protein